MLIKIRIFLSLITIISITSCEPLPFPNPGYLYHTGHFPETPVNLEEFNSVYDDYNSTFPYFSETFPFCFSSKQLNGGLNFDIVYKIMSVSFSKETGELKIYEKFGNHLDIIIENENIRKAVGKINTGSDELGPNLISMGKNYNSSNMNGKYNSYVLMYSSDHSGNQDIYFTQNLELENYEDPISVDFLNSDSDDGYPTITHDTTALYFTSNRLGSFDIFRIAMDEDERIVELLSTENSYLPEIDPVLSSEQDDTCPSIYNKLMVFASNREGGFGGYDLYYSYFENGSWSEPINFGDQINTEYDEYRPIVRSDAYQFDNDMMIFSSNRPGGMGGFDLYCVGIQRQEESN